MKAHLDFQTEKVESDEEERLELLRSGPSDQEVGISTEKGRMAFISKERESTGEDSTIPPSFMTYHDEV